MLDGTRRESDPLVDSRYAQSSPATVSSSQRREETMKGREAERWRTFLYVICTGQIFCGPKISNLVEDPREQRQSDETCVFRHLVETPSAEWPEGQERIVFETERVVVVKDKFPAIENHLLVFPRTPIRSVKALRRTKEDAALLQDMIEAGRQALRDVGAPGPESSWKIGFHIPPFNSMDHLHMHCVAGERSWRGTLKFDLNKRFFADADDVLSELLRTKL